MAKNSLDQALNEALETADKIRSTFTEIDKNILSAAKNARKLADSDLDTPSAKNLNDRLQKDAGYRKQVTALMKEQEAQMRALERAHAKLNIASSKGQKELEKTRFEQKQVNKENREMAALSSKLATAYQKQSIVLNQLRRAYKDLALKKEDGVQLTKKEIVEMNRLENEIQQLDNKLKKVDAAVGQHQRSVGNYGKAWAGVKDIMISAVAAFGIYEAINIGKQIYTQIKEINALNNALQQVTETQEDYNQALDFVIKVSDRAGAGINTIQKAYTKFYASAKETNLTLEETQYIFETIATAGGVMALSTEDINGALRAMEQMLSKGKIQAEEIRGQMGERLPGAFQMLAKSMGLTTRELDKQLELGNVIAEEVLPNFAREYAKAYGIDKLKNVQTLVAAETRMKNNWNLFIRDLEQGNGFISRVLMGTFDGLSAKLKQTTEDTSELGDQISKVGDVFQETLNDIEDITGETEALSGQVEYLANGFKLLKALFTVSIFEVWAEMIKFVRVTFESLSASIKKTKDITGELIGYIKNGELSKAYDVVANANKMISSSFMNEWDAAYGSVKTNTEAIEKQMKSFVARYGSLAPLAKDKPFWDFTQMPIPEDETTTGGGGGKIPQRDKVSPLSVNEESLKSVQFSVEWFERLIKVAKDTQAQVSRTSEEYRKQGEEIKRLEKIVEDIKGFNLEIDDEELKELQYHLNKKIPDAMSHLADVLGTDMSALMQEFVSYYEWDYNEFLKFQQKKIAAAEESNEIQKEKLAEWMQNSSDVIYEVGNLFAALSDRKIQKIDDEIARQDEQYEKWLANEKLSERQRKILEDQREEDRQRLKKKKQKEKEKAAKIDKAFAMFDIAINTAAAVVKALPNIPLSILVGTLGALQIATVAARPIPKYKHGRKDGKAEIAYTGDGGKHEVITDRKGNPKFISPKTATLTPLAAGDKVFPDVPSYFDAMSIDDLNRAAIMTSLNSQANKLNEKETQNNLNKEILAAIKEGNSKKAIPPPAPDYDTLARSIAKEMNFMRRRDV